jgi:hypothetical protein
MTCMRRGWDGAMPPLHAAERRPVSDGDVSGLVHLSAADFDLDMIKFHIIGQAGAPHPAPKDEFPAHPYKIPCLG